MKKQLFRVKQFADQTLGRGGKSNALCDDLHDADRKAEYIKNSCQNVSKKISACLLLSTVQSDAATSKDKKEKTLKKCPEYALSAAMKQCSATCDENSSLRSCLDLCGRTEEGLAENYVERDTTIDTNVVVHLQELLDNEIPSVAKHKRNVIRLCAERDNAQARHGQAQNKHSGGAPGSTKAVSVKEELEECETKLEQARDVFACEMFHLIVKESEICHNMLDLYRYRRTYYADALAKLDALIPQLETVVGDSSVKRVYGTKLEDHLRITNRTIAFPIELCVCAILELGIEEEGIFRLGGSATKVKRMKLSMDAGCMTLATALAYRDPHVIAGCLKSYLRELPEPLLTFALYEDWLDAARVQVAEPERLRLLKIVVDRLPGAQYENLRYLTHFFHLLSKYQDSNKMTPQNIAIVLAPNLLWMDQENPGMFLNATTFYPYIVQLLVVNAHYFFPSEPEYYVTLEPMANGEHEGIDNKGFDPRTSDNGMKRSQSTNSLNDDPPGSPKPMQRKRNKPVAPTPPVAKPPRPSAAPTVSTTSTLPRHKPPRDHKATATEDPMTQSVGSVEAFMKAEVDSEVKLRAKEEKKPKATVGTNTDVEMRPDLKSMKMQFLHGKPAIPERPPTLKPTGVKALRSAFDGSAPLGAVQNYENVSLSSNENLSGDERTLQRTQLYSIDKHITSIIQVNNDKKRERSREKKRSDGTDTPPLPSCDDVKEDKPPLIQVEVNQSQSEDVKVVKPPLPNPDDVKVVKPPMPHPEDVKMAKPPLPHPEDIRVVKPLVSAVEDVQVVKPPLPLADDAKTSVEVEGENRKLSGGTPERRKSSESIGKRPSSLSGCEKPERPPKPEHITSPSHTRTLSDGQIIDRVQRDVNANEGRTLKHPTTSPPPPPVPAKPRANSHGESTDL